MEHNIHVILGEEEKLHTHPGLEMIYRLPLSEVIVDDEFKHLFKWYKEIPDKPGHIIVKRSEYEYIKFG